MSDTEHDSRRPDSGESGPVPDWDDEYFDRVSDRLMNNYDLEKDRRVAGERFDLYGHLRIENQKQFLHPSINFANHHVHEHLLATRLDGVARRDLERLVDLGHELAGEWIEADEEHQGTDFTFVVVTDDVPDEVRSFVAGFSDRTLLRYGFHGHYELNLGVVAPDREDAVASEHADVVRAFTLWDDAAPTESPGLLSRLVSRLRG
ncbi:MAG: hypothetical protein ABEJ22_02015 [Haloferacaceae archaeon]